jgi:hypothetical protein
MGRTSWFLFIGGIVVLASCRSAPKSSAATASSSTVPRDLSGSIFPGDIAPHPLAQKLCEVLHVLPGRRVAECCGTKPAAPLLEECIRVVSASIGSRAVEIDPPAIDRCSVAMEQSLTGCDWVTPSLPLAPAACEQVIAGTVREGEVCRSSLECVGNLHCDGLSPTRTGTCARPQANGAVCGAHVDTVATYTLQRHLETSRPFCSEWCSMMTHKCGPAPAKSSAPPPAEAARIKQCAPSWESYQARASGTAMTLPRVSR